MKKKKIVKITCVIIIVFIILYFVLVNFLVSAALVPSFMQKLEAFERITEESYAAQVQTSDIKVNRQVAINETNEWLAAAECRKIAVKTEDNYTLIAEEFFTETDSHKWVLLLHGYTGWKEEMYPFAYWYHEQGYHIVAPDLRCQGESEGDFIGMGWTDHFDCILWMNYILSQDADAEMVIHGHSMGAATALMMAGDEKTSENIAAVISDCAYTDAYSMFGEKITTWFYLPPFPIVDTACVVLQLRGGYNLKDASAIEAVAQSSTPILFIHGEQDDMIPVQMSKDLYEAAGGPKELLIIKGAGHAQAQDKAPEAYYGAIEAFLAEYVQ